MSGAPARGVAQTPSATQAPHCATVISERLFAVSAPSALGGDRDAIALRDLLAAPLLLPSARNWIRDLLDRAAEGLGRAASPTLEIDSAELLKNLAADGAGVAVLPFGAVQRDVAAGRLAARPIVEPETLSNLNLIYLKDRPPDRAASELIRLIADMLEEIVGGAAPHGFVEIRRPDRSAPRQG